VYLRSSDASRAGQMSPRGHRVAPAGRRL